MSAPRSVAGRIPYAGEDPDIDAKSTPSASPAADALEGLATLAWGLPATFAFAYALSWYFSVKNLLLVFGHIAFLVVTSLAIECAHRMRESRAAIGPARVSQLLATAAALLTVYAIYPMARMFLEMETPVFASIESADPRARLAMTMTLAYALSAGALASLVVALRRAGSELGVELRRSTAMILGPLVAAALAALLHSAFGHDPAMRELRHPLALGLLLVGGFMIFAFRPAALRVAAALRHRASRDAAASTDA